MKKKVPAKKIWASHAFAPVTHFPSRVMQFHYKTITWNWNQINITIHTRERYANVYDVHRLPSYCTLVYTNSKFLRTIRIHAGKCHMQSQT
jgi:hypothetical protein